MQIQLLGGFFLFSLRTKAHYFGHTILHGGAKYRATGHGFVIRHGKVLNFHPGSFKVVYPFHL